MKIIKMINKKIAIQIKLKIIKLKNWKEKLVKVKIKVLKFKMKWCLKMILKKKMINQQVVIIVFLVVKI